MAQKTTVQPMEDTQVGPDKIVLEVFGWVNKGTSAQRIRAYLAAKDRTTAMVLSACAKVEEAVRVQSGQLNDQANQVEFSLRLEKETYTEALEREQLLQQQAEALAEAARRVIIFFRPKTEELTAAKTTPVPLTQSVVRAAVDFFREPTRESVSPPPVGEVQLPPTDDVYQEIPTILDMNDPSVEATQEWDDIRELPEGEGTAPEQELANVGVTYASLQPLWQRAQLMGERQAEQSKGIITAIQAHWARVQETTKQQLSTIEQQKQKLAAFQTACEKVREAMRAVQAL